LEYSSVPKCTLIINYAGLQVGGIETYLAKLMLYSVGKQYRVIWLTTPKCVETAFFKEVSLSPNIEKVYVQKGRHWFVHSGVRLAAEENVTMISCEPLDFMMAESLRGATCVHTFFHYLILPHYTGNAYYPERFLGSGRLKAVCWGFMRTLVKKWNDEDCIRAFSLKHLEAYEKNYAIEIADKNSKVLPSIKMMDVFEEEYFNKKAAERSEKFTIVTCSRFDFPHKGYLLGLLDCYAELKSKYSQLRLIIIGYGDGEKQLREKISTLPSCARKDIVLTGALLPEEVKVQFREGHLNIGLAGALLDGAACGLPSLLVRHYSWSCETYGFISDIEGTFLREDEGQSIGSFIEQMLTSDKEKYIDQCLADYQCVHNRRKYDPEYLFKQKNKSSCTTLETKMVWKAKLLNFSCYMKRRFFHVPSYDN